MFKHEYRPNRFARVKAEIEDRVLYDAYEGDKCIYSNMVLPELVFYSEYCSIV